MTQPLPMAGASAQVNQAGLSKNDYRGSPSTLCQGCGHNSIANQLITRQGDFFNKGPRFLRPLTMNEIADALGMHATTVSRAVADKYILTPQGLMEMRVFFATGYETDDGGKVSNEGVRQAIQQLVAAENPAKPLSDELLMKALAKQGISVARRTVAKYREQMNILPSHLRKTF